MPVDRSAAVPRPDRHRSSPLQLLNLPFHPGTVIPRLASRQGSLALLGFPAVSGVFVAYMVARALNLGDRFGFAAVAAGVMVIGAIMGLIVLWFIGMMPEWSGPDTDESQVNTARMFALFSNATWPFLPLAIIVIGLDALYNRDTMFSAIRPGMPTALTWTTHGLTLAAILLWLVMMVRGTAVIRRESEAEAARDLVRWGLELVIIFVLFAVAVGASVAYW